MLWGSLYVPYGSRYGAGRALPHTLTPVPRSATYVYYEQYLTVVAEGLLTVALCLAPTFLVSFLLLGMDLRSSLATVITIAMILLDTVGLMALWGVPYNAVALINLVAVRGGWMGGCGVDGVMWGVGGMGIWGDVGSWGDVGWMGWCGGVG